MEKTIKELKQEFMKAYRWCRRAQEACLLKQVDIRVFHGFCEANYSRNTLSAWTVTVSIWDAERSAHVTATWVPWRPEDFEKEKQGVIEYLKEKGITVK